MKQIRIHGRGGQGVVTAAEMLSLAAFEEGRHAQAFPSFGSERTGAPVVAFCRISEREIRSREPIMAPDAVIIQDPTLLHQVDVFAGLKPDGLVLINTTRSFEELGLGEFSRGRARKLLLTVPATDIALKHVGRPVPNVPLLGAFAAATGLVQLDSVKQAILHTFAETVARGNIAAAEEAFASVTLQLSQLSQMPQPSQPRAQHEESAHA